MGAVKNPVSTVGVQDFVADALRQILAGIEEAQAFAHDRGSGVVTFSPADGREIKVGFDIAVTAQSGVQTKGGIAVVAGMFTLGSAGQTDQQASNVSRLRFEIPIRPMSQADRDHKLKQRQSVTP